MSEKTLTIEEMLSAPDVRYDYVQVPEWAAGGRARIASLTAGDMIEWLEARRDPLKGQSSGLQLIQKALVNDSGDHICKSEHLELFRKKNTQVCGRIVDAIMKMNGLGGARLAETLLPEFITLLTSIVELSKKNETLSPDILTRVSELLTRATGGGVEVAKNVSSEAVIVASPMTSRVN